MGRHSREQSSQRELSASWNSSWTTWKKICSMRDPNSETSWQNWTRSWQRSLARHNQTNPKQNSPFVFTGYHLSQICSTTFATTSVLFHGQKTTMLPLHHAIFKSDNLVSHL